MISKQNKYIKIKQKAFTLIELIMVMTIIGAMAGIFLFNYPGTQVTSRDTQRRSDLRQYQTAIETFANVNGGLYPKWASATNLDGTLCSTHLGLNSCPADPRDGETDCQTNLCRYYYRSDNCDGSGSNGDACAAQYVIWAALEKPVSDNYWIICSNGEVGEGSSAPTSSACPI